MIPNYNLFGEAEDLPDVVHCETIEIRSKLHDWELAVHRHARLHQLLHLADGAGIVSLEGTRHALRIIRELLYFKMPKRKTDIPGAMDYLGRVLKKRATVFLVSDFIERDFKRPLALMNKRHDVVAVSVRDRAEKRLPNVGLIELEDAETGEIVMVDTGRRFFRKSYESASQKRFDELRGMLRSIDVDCIDIGTDKAYINDLVQFFHMRHRRK